MKHNLLGRSLTTLSLITLFSYSSKAQVNDISLTLSPNVEYTWWDDQAGLEDGYLAGGNLGFGFGKYLEVRALYQQGVDLKRDFSSFGLPDGYNDILGNNNDVDLTRWGGELKANIGTGSLNPFVTLGSGVQKLETDFGTETENIYASLGLGIKFNISDRTTLTLEGKNTAFNGNNGMALLSDTERSDLGLSDDFFESDRLYNWSALASLQFYLGGRSPEQMSDLDRAYLEKFKGGLQGFQFVFEPAAAYVDFDSDALFRDSYFLGGYLGFDFNEYIGIRGFYFQATQDEELSTDFDDLAMYGLELRANLNDGNGVIPYIVLGGGYLNAYENTYLGVDGNRTESTEFAKGGLGLEIPLGRNVSLNGSASGLLTSGLDLEDVSDTDNLQTNMMYSVGLSIQLGRKGKNPNQIYNKNVESAVGQREQELNQAFEEKLAAQKQANEEKLNKLQESYQKQIDSLDNALEEAYDRNDVEGAVEILEESQQLKEDMQKVQKLQSKNNSQVRQLLQQVEAREEKAKEVEVETVEVEKQKTQSVNDKQSGDRQYSMTPLEFEYLITRILDKMEAQDQQPKTSSDSKSTEEELQRRIMELEDRISRDAYNRNNMQQRPERRQESRKKSSDKNSDVDRIFRKLEDLESKIEDNNRKIENSSSSNYTPSTDNSRTRIVNEVRTEGNTVEKKNPDSNSELVEIEGEVSDTKTTYKREFFTDRPYIANERKSKISSGLVYKGVSAFTGVNLGGQDTWNFGAKAHYGFENNNIEILPEISFAPSDPISFGAAINAIHPFRMSSQMNIRPYLGLGAGYLNNDEDSVFTGNLIIGMYTEALGGRLYVDYTNRNLFNYNQFALGYRFNF